MELLTLNVYKSEYYIIISKILSQLYAGCFVEISVDDEAAKPLTMQR